MTKIDQSTVDTIDAPEAGSTRFITPLDVRQSTFPTSWRGYAQAAVRTFLLETSEHFEQALRENERLRQEIGRLEGVIRQHKEIETTLQNTMVHAQKVSDDLRTGAQLEAERIVREANGRAELLMAAAQNRLEDAAAGDGRPEAASAAKPSARWSRSSRRCTARSSSSASSSAIRRCSRTGHAWTSRSLRRVAGSRLWLKRFLSSFTVIVGTAPEDIATRLAPGRRRRGRGPVRVRAPGRTLSPVSLTR